MQPPILCPGGFTTDQQSAPVMHILDSSTSLHESSRIRQPWRPRSKVPDVTLVPPPEMTHTCAVAGMRRKENRPYLTLVQWICACNRATELPVSHHSSTHRHKAATHTQCCTPDAVLWQRTKPVVTNWTQLISHLHD